MEAKKINPSILFYASSLALITTAMTFAIRGGLMGTWQVEFGLSNTQVGFINSAAFYGFTISMLLGGILVDVLGMGTLLAVAFGCHLAGTVLTIYAGGYGSLLASTLIIGLANGLVEAACNPLVAGIYSTQKTKMLNRFHVWFPGGIVLGGLLSYFIAQAGLPWQWQMATILVPNVLYGLLFLRRSFPPTERVSAGVSTADMLLSCLNPLFLFMVVCMFITAASELGTNQWISLLLEKTGFVSGILVLVFINGIMALGRLFAGPVVHRLASQGILLASAALACLGLVWLSQAGGYWLFPAAAVFAAGICYFWPTMLGFVNENIPRSGAMGLAIMGAAGNLSVAVFQPVLGGWLDKNTTAAQQALAAQGMSTEAMQVPMNVMASQQTLLDVALLPGMLVLAFGLLQLYMRDKNRKKLAL